MKLAECLITRKDLQVKLQQLKNQMRANVRVQEGDQPSVAPAAILQTYQETSRELAELITRINETNAVVVIDKLGMTLTAAIEAREAARRNFQMLEEAINSAEQRQDMYSRSEIRMVVTIDLPEYHRKRDQIAKKIREFDVAIQETNWQTDLPE